MGKVPRDPLQEAMRMLGRKPYSCLGLSEALTRKGYSSETVAGTLQQLQDWGYLSDERFVEERIAHYRELGKGRMFIEFRLVEQGVSAKMARELMERWYPGHEESELARKLTAAHFKGRVPIRTEKHRWVRSLAAAGFSPEAIEASGCWDEEA